MNKHILLLTPPFTQLNTPYPATAYLKGFLNTKDISSFQADLGLEVLLKLFSQEGLCKLFAEIEQLDTELSPKTKKILKLKAYYLNTIDSVIVFLQNKNPNLAYIICQGGYLPEVSRIEKYGTNHDKDLDWAFGAMGVQEKAKYLATLYLEDLSSLVKENLDPHFGFSRYAESLARAASSFDNIEKELTRPDSFIDRILIGILEKRILEIKPKIVALSIPFPGNLYSGLKCGQWIKKNFPETKIVLGGGYASTELRSLQDYRVFNYTDFICLDDGEAPLYSIVEYIIGKRELGDLKRTFTLQDDSVVYIDGAKEKDYSIQQIGIPDYSDLLLDKYISVIEVVNPMNRLWSDGCWNKLMLAHGCYWGRCTFCDVSLDYIKRFEPQPASQICDKIEAIIKQTKQTGFHFVDEAAPPALLKELALEIIRRKITITWWGNIRFEKNFTQDLCVLLKESGCIAVSGGLEVASDRLLSIINKGVTVSQVAKVANHFTKAGIMVHAYLMYGFPTQTEQETIDSLEVVRQIFKEGIVQSGFWHLFTMTAHSPIGLNPEQFNVRKLNNTIGAFANNDVLHVDDEGANHSLYGDGLKKALYNFMHGVFLDYPLHEWFEGITVPKTTVPAKFIKSILETDQDFTFSLRSKVLWLGSNPEIRFFTKNKKGRTFQMAELQFVNKNKEFVLKTGKEVGEWLFETLPKLSVLENTYVTYADLQKDFNKNNLGDFDAFFISRAVNQLRKNGLLIL